MALDIRIVQDLDGNLFGLTKRGERHRARKKHGLKVGQWYLLDPFDDNVIRPLTEAEANEAEMEFWFNVRKV